MFDSMMRLVTEQQLLRDGAVERKEFDTVGPPSGLSAESRAELLASVLAATPAHHRFMSAKGGQGIVYFDQRGRATSAVLDDLDDEELSWISSSNGTKPMSTLGGGGTGYRRPDLAEETMVEGRTEIEKFIFAKSPPDSKKKSGGAMTVMMTGEVAKAAGVKVYKTVKLSDLSDAQINAIAKVLGYKPMPESAIGRYEAGEPVKYSDLKREGWGSRVGGKLGDFLRTEAGPGIPPDVARTNTTAAANAKKFGHLSTFKKGEFWKSKSQGLWFYPMEDQKNGGVKGLQLDLSFSKKPKMKSLTAAEKPRGRNEFWVVAKPEEEILSHFRKHDDFEE